MCNALQPILLLTSQQLGENKMIDKKVGDIVIKRLIYEPAGSKLDAMYELCTVVSVDADSISISDSIGDVIRVDPYDYQIVSELTKRKDFTQDILCDLYDIKKKIENCIEQLNQLSQ